MNQSTGFIGLGEMGLPIARNICKAGYKLTAFDLNNSALEAIEKEGAITVNSCYEVAKASEVVFLMVRDSSQVEQAMLGDKGVIAGANSGTIIIIMSTVEPKLVKKMSAVAKKHDLYLLDAPVSGAHTGAADATLTILVGGPKDIYLKCESIFNVIGKNIFYLGESGSGEGAKLVNNLLLLVNIGTVYEGLSLADRIGLDKDILFNVIKVSSGGSWVVDNWPLVSSWKDNYRPNETFDLALKDLKLILSVGEDNNTPLLFAALASQLLRS